MGTIAAGRTRAGSTRHVTVDDETAEVLHADFPALSPVEIRECLEFEPVRMAMGVLAWASRAGDPHKALRSWARKRRRGHYRRRADKPDGAAEYRRHLAFIERREKTMRDGRGRGLTQPEIEDAAREFYAPAHRASLAAIPQPAWGSYHAGLQEEGAGLTGV